jgi:CDP-glycerol glycerophosphotransferase (TagB/SpsB family)
MTRDIEAFPLREKGKSRDVFRVVLKPVDRIETGPSNFTVCLPLKFENADTKELRAYLESRSNTGKLLARVDAELTKKVLRSGKKRWRLSVAVDLKAIISANSERNVFYFNVRVVDRHGNEAVAPVVDMAPALPLLNDRSVAYFRNLPEHFLWRLVFSRASGRMQIRKVATAIAHVRVERAQRVGKRLYLRGAAVVPGVDSSALEPSIVVRRRHTNIETVFPMRRMARDDIATIFAADVADHSMAGFEGEVDIEAVFAAGILAERFGDFYIRLARSDGFAYERRLSGPAQSLRQKYANEDICAFRDVKPDSDIFPYFSKGAYELTLTYRERPVEDTWPYLLREYLAIMLFYLFGGREGREWLTYETYSSTAQDNSFVFFEWMRRHHPEQPFYYVIRDDSPDRDRLTPYGHNVLSYYSVRHLFHLLRCSLLVSAQSRAHVYKIRPLRGLFKRHLLAKKLVFLQHGVTAFKRSSFHKTDPNGSADLLITVSKNERDIVKKHWRYPDREVAITGFPRFDVLRNKAAEQERPSILIMPTWRRWLEGASLEDFEASEFCRAYADLLNDPQLLALLEENDMEVMFYLHITLLKYVPLMKPQSPRIKIMTLGDLPVNELMMRASVLVTDYSSVAWDFHYMQKPVVFFHFDLNRYLSTHGSFINLRGKLFGARAADVPTLVQKISEAVTSTDPVRVSEDHFRYNDQANCERVYAAITDRFGY